MVLHVPGSGSEGGGGGGAPQATYPGLGRLKHFLASRGFYAVSAVPTSLVIATSCQKKLKRSTQEALLVDVEFSDGKPGNVGLDSACQPKREILASLHSHSGLCRHGLTFIFDINE